LFTFVGASRGHRCDSTAFLYCLLYTAKYCYMVGIANFASDKKWGGDSKAGKQWTLKIGDSSLIEVYAYDIRDGQKFYSSVVLCHNCPHRHLDKTPAQVTELTGRTHAPSRVTQQLSINGHELTYDSHDYRIRCIFCIYCKSPQCESYLLLNDSFDCLVVLEM